MQCTTQHKARQAQAPDGPQPGQQHPIPARHKPQHYHKPPKPGTAHQPKTGQSCPDPQGSTRRLTRAPPTSTGGHLRPGVPSTTHRAVRHATQTSSVLYRAPTRTSTTHTSHAQTPALSQAATPRHCSLAKKGQPRPDLAASIHRIQQPGRLPLGDEAGRLQDRAATPQPRHGDP